MKSLKRFTILLSLSFLFWAHNPGQTYAASGQGTACGANNPPSTETTGIGGGSNDVGGFEESLSEGGGYGEMFGGAFGDFLGGMGNSLNSFFDLLGL